MTAEKCDMERRKTNEMSSTIASADSLQAVFKVTTQRAKRPTKACIKQAEFVWKSTGKKVADQEEEKTNKPPDVFRKSPGASGCVLISACMRGAMSEARK